MTDEQIALARCAVACKSWRWLPGMLHGTQGESGLKWTSRYSDLGLDVDADRLPDLTDAATLGCLFALVTEAYYDPKRLWDGYVEIHRDQHAVFYLEQAVHDEDGYLVWNCVCSGETKAEVLVHALEIAT